MCLLDFTDDLGGYTHSHTVVGNDVIFPDYSACADDAIAADDRTRKNDGTHADHGMVTDGAAVDDGSVTDGAAFPNSGLGMENAVVLNVGAGTDVDFSRITTDDRAVPDVDSILQLNISHHRGIGGDIDSTVLDNTAHNIPLSILIDLVYPETKGKATEKRWILHYFSVSTKFDRFRIGRNVHCDCGGRPSH